NSNKVECTVLEKEMMRRKMKAWKKKEKGVEVSQEVSLEKSLVFFEKPKFDSISKVKGPEKKLELC
ncbi:hypothetical protein HID58_020786, partial [Brassica napus]